MAILSASSDPLSQIVTALFLIVAALTPIAIVALAVRAYLGSPPPRAAVVLRALFALGGWLVITLTLVLVFVMIVYVNSESLPIEQALMWDTIWLVAFTIGYAAVCGILAWWASWKRKAATESNQ